MRKFLLAIVAAGFLSACGSHVKHEELDEALDGARAQSQADAEDASVAVHECVLVREFIVESPIPSYCRQGAQEFCNVIETYVGYCVVFDDENNLLPPRPGVMDAVDDALSLVETDVSLY